MEGGGGIIPPTPGQMPGSSTTYFLSCVFKELCTVPSLLYISKHVDISAGALRMTASLFSTRENVHWEIYYYPQGSPVRVDISAGDFLWKFTVTLRTPSEMSTV